MEDLEFTPDQLQRMHALQKRSLAHSPHNQPEYLLKEPEDRKFFAALPGVMKKFEKDFKKKR